MASSSSRRSAQRWVSRLVLAAASLLSVGVSARVIQIPLDDLMVPVRVRTVAGRVTSTGSASPAVVSVSAGSLTRSVIPGKEFVLAVKRPGSYRVSVTDPSTPTLICSTTPSYRDVVLGPDAEEVDFTVNCTTNSPPTISSFSVNPAGPRAAPATFNLSATASDSDGVSRVEFWTTSGTLLATINPAPYNWTCTGVPAGSYSVFARAFDPHGASSQSTSVTVQVTSTNQPPTISVTKPAASASIGTPIALEANAQDSDGEVTLVEYFDAQTNAVVASSSIGPTFAASWNASVGSHSVYARARDNSGAITQSSTVGFTVAQPFTFALAATGSSFPFTSGASATFTASIDAAAGTVSQAKLYRDGAFVGDLTGSGSLWQGTFALPIALGLYSYAATANNSAGIPGASNTALVTVESTSTSPAPDVRLAEQTGALPGATAGVANVTALGAATYSIPIVVPSGIAGLVPSLSLTYSSQPGNGLLGQGWTLQGLSVIHRCPPSYLRDARKAEIKYDETDPLCLDGQRLVPISGYTPGAGRNATIQYRTENETYSRIEATNAPTTAVWSGPAQFKVWTKSGQILYYGMKTAERPADPWNADQDSVLRVTPYGSKPESARSWALYRVEDRSGNYLRVVYEKWDDYGQLRPSRIDYTGNSTTGALPFAQAQFAYEDRETSDNPKLFDSGAQVTRLDKHLKSVTTFADNVGVKN